ncbi:MAG: RAD55 family ATPase [Myxococcales bacterium]
MKARRPAGPHPMPRVATGIEQLDIILRGGFLRGGSYIVAGSPGTGKTILGNQVGFRHAALGGKSVYISLLAESHGRMLSHISTMSFYDPEAIGQTIQYVSGYEPLREGGLKALLELIRKVVKRFGATLLVVDGIITAERAASSGEEFKVFVHELNVALTLLGCTAVLLTNVLDDDRSYAARTMVDGLINIEDVMDGVRAVRQLIVAKFRGSDYLRGAHFFEIGSDGIRVYPRIESMLAVPSKTPGTSSERKGFGIPDLDAMMAGGPPDGTATLVLGSSGTGKTILGMHFLSEGARQKEPGLYFGFFESPARFAQQGDLLGLQLSKYAKKGLLEIIWQPTGGLIMDALAEKLFEAVRRRGVKRLVIDGIAGFEESVVRRERLGMFFTSVANELRGLGVTTVMTEEMRELFGAEVIIPVSGVSGLAENIILVRQLEYVSELKRAIAVMKTRETRHDERLRELTITDRGIAIGDPFEFEEAVLTGGSSRARPASPGRSGSKRRGRGGA